MPTCISGADNPQGDPANSVRQGEYFGAREKLTGDFNFGSVKGRDRHMLLWLVNASCLWEMCTGGKGGRMILGAWDVDNAFPSMWQDGVDWMMWQAGVRGKMWRVLREMEKKFGEG